MRDENKHAVRKKSLTHGFSQAAVMKMEHFIDERLVVLRSKLNSFAKSKETFDLKMWLRFFVIDVLGELAFSQSFGMLESGDESKEPTVAKHLMLATMVSLARKCCLIMCIYRQVKCRGLFHS